MKHCVNLNCKNNCTNVVRNGRCSPCQKYFRRHGEERPFEMCTKMYYRHSKHRPRHCKVCDNPKIIAWGRCAACHVYWKANGKPRPRHLWDKNMGCLTCGVRLHSLPPGRRRSGRCAPCDSYWRRKGYDRPREYWGIGEYGWCSCGRGADHCVEGVGKCTRCKDAS